MALHNKMSGFSMLQTTMALAVSTSISATAMQYLPDMSDAAEIAVISHSAAVEARHHSLWSEYNKAMGHPLTSRSVSDDNESSSVTHIEQADIPDPIRFGFNVVDHKVVSTSGNFCYDLGDYSVHQTGCIAQQTVSKN